MFDDERAGLIYCFEGVDFMNKFKDFLKDVITLCKMRENAPAWTEYLANFFTFLTAGTDCRCCLGARITIAFAVGLLLG